MCTLTQRQGLVVTFDTNIIYNSITLIKNKSYNQYGYQALLWASNGV